VEPPLGLPSLPSLAATGSLDAATGRRATGGATVTALAGARAATEEVEVGQGGKIQARKLGGLGRGRQAVHKARTRAGHGKGADWDETPQLCLGARQQWQLELLPRLEGRDAALDGYGRGEAGAGEEDGEVGELHVDSGRWREQDLWSRIGFVGSCSGVACLSVGVRVSE
jgi:hypothetical protein